MTNQPDWELIAQLGDVDPIEYGGFFVYRDKTGVYPEEAELLQQVQEEVNEYEIRRFILDRCTDIDGILSDNQFHPETPAWFADSLEQIAAYWDLPTIRADLCSEDPIARAHAYHAIGDYHGLDNLDSYPLILKRHEAQERYGFPVDDVVEVVVGNIGTVYHDHDEDDAREVFDTYKDLSENSPGHRAYREPVTLMIAGEIAEEHTPDEPQDDDYIISDRRGGGYNVYRGGVCILSTTADGFDDLLPLIRGDMEKEQYWPTVWRERERGGFDIINTTTGGIIQ